LAKFCVFAQQQIKKNKRELFIRSFFAYYFFLIDMGKKKAIIVYKTNNSIPFQINFEKRIVSYWNDNNKIVATVRV
jgi:hypothetical protein